MQLAGLVENRFDTNIVSRKIADLHHNILDKTVNE